MKEQLAVCQLSARMIIPWPMATPRDESVMIWEWRAASASSGSSGRGDAIDHQDAHAGWILHAGSARVSELLRAQRSAVFENVCLLLFRPWISEGGEALEFFLVDHVAGFSGVPSQSKCYAKRLSWGFSRNSPKFCDRDRQTIGDNVLADSLSQDRLIRGGECLFKDRRACYRSTLWDFLKPNRRLSPKQRRLTRTRPSIGRSSATVR